MGSRPDACEYWLVEKARNMCRYLTDDAYIARYVGGISAGRVASLRQGLPGHERYPTMGAVLDRPPYEDQHHSAQRTFDELDRLSRSRALTDQESVRLHNAIRYLDQTASRRRRNQRQQERRQRGMQG